MNGALRASLGRKKATRAVVLGCCLAMAACTERCPLDPGEQHVVSRWLDCGDCLEGELDSLVALAGRKPGPSVTALRSALLAGPGQRRLTRYAGSLDSTFSRDSAVGTSPALTRPVFVRRFVENYRASYRKRAAFALARIGSAEARAALDSAFSHPYTGADTLRKDVSEFLVRMQTWTPPPVATVVVP